MKVKLAREVATAELNNFCDWLGMEEEDRVEIDLQAVSRIQEMIEQGIIEQDKKESEIEKTDVVRESIVKAIQKGIIYIDESHQMFMKPRIIPVNEDKEPLFENLKIKSRVTYEEEKFFMKGVNMSDGTAVIFAKICARVAKTPILIQKLDSRDVDVLTAIEVFFRRAD